MKMYLTGVQISSERGLIFVSLFASHYVQIPLTKKPVTFTQTEPSIVCNWLAYAYSDNHKRHILMHFRSCMKHRWVSNTFIQKRFTMETVSPNNRFMKSRIQYNDQLLTYS